MTPQTEYYKDARKKIAEINKQKSNYAIIWYARVKVEEIWRIVAIRVQTFSNLSGQPHTFSIDYEANILKEKFIGTKDDYDKCEKNMLNRFYGFVRTEGKNKTWLHWRMNLSNYSFEELENSYRSLGGRPIAISDNNKIDICELFRHRYGENFVNKKKKKDRSSWRIKYLAEKNGIETASYLEYAEEENAFKNKQYDEILSSLSRKTSIITHFLDLSYKDRLKTDSTWTEVHGISLQGWYDAVSGKWWFAAVTFVLGVVLGSVITKYL